MISETRTKIHSWLYSPKSLAKKVVIGTAVVLTASVPAVSAIVLNNEPKSVQNSAVTAESTEKKLNQLAEDAKNDPGTNQDQTNSATPVVVNPENSSSAQNNADATSDPVEESLSLYEKYGVTETVVQAFGSYYPDYFSYDTELFIQYVASVYEVSPGFNLESHAISTGLKGVGQDHYKQAEKNSFLRLIITNSNLPYTPWATVL